MKRFLKFILALAVIFTFSSCEELSMYDFSFLDGWGSEQSDGADLAATSQSATIDNATDLGLSVLWATVNVGAEYEYEIGQRFAWGETTPDKEWYDWDNYAWAQDENGRIHITKYSYGIDNDLSLEPEDDAASVIMGGNWRMPTAKELFELYQNCTWECEAISDVVGYRVTGPNGNSIFLPCNGQWDDSGLVRTGEVFLWGSECDGNNMAYRLLDTEGVGACNERHDGLCIRAVMTK